MIVCRYNESREVVISATMNFVVTDILPMAHYAFNTPMLSNELPGWQDTLSCPFCLNIAVECIRLPHAEPDRDCGVCACAACVREWITFSNNVGLACPRCRHPICEVHLKNSCDQPNCGDPVITRLLANVVTHFGQRVAFWLVIQETRVLFIPHTCIITHVVTWWLYFLNCA